MEEGDIVAALNGGAALVRIDADTGDRTVISCSEGWEPSSVCPTSVGTGPPALVDAGMTISKDGGILVGSYLGSVPGYEHHLGALLRVDPATGNRVIVSSAAVGTGPHDGYGGGLPAIAVMPAPDYFNIATLPPLAIALVVGFLLGVSWMVGRRQAA